MSIVFDGKLTAEEESNLINGGFSKKDLEKIKYYLFKYRDSLNGFKDLVGDVPVPDKCFLTNLKLFGDLLDTDPEKTITKKGVWVRKNIVYPIVHTLGPNFLLSKQVFENRNVLMGITDENGKIKEDAGITLPDDPVIWTSNHHFKDDALGSALAAKRPAYLVLGSLPLAYNTLDGLLGYLFGCIMINRKNKESRKSAVKKMEKVLECGADLVVWPEGVWNKSPNQLLQHLWPGIYRVAMDKGVNLVPIVHYISDPVQSMGKKANPIHTVVDDPIDFTKMHGMSESACLSYYRDVMATWYYLMMEKYGKDTHAELLRGYDSPVAAYEDRLERLIGVLVRFDKEIETTSHYQPKDVVTVPDVYQCVADLPVTRQNAQTVIGAKKLVKEYKTNDFQSRF